MAAKWNPLGQPSPPGMGAPPPPRPFADLFHAHKRFVSHLARRAGVPFGDVPDVVQKVFMALHEATVERGLDTGAPLWGGFAR
jgi:DNA-directed RNA polymerase specialized sigma24 family protein